MNLHVNPPLTEAEKFEASFAINNLTHTDEYSEAFVSRVGELADVVDPTHANRGIQDLLADAEHLNCCGDHFTARAKASLALALIGTVKQLEAS